MRTTVTIDDDVAAAVASEARSSGRSFKETINTLLRRGLVKQGCSDDVPPFRVEAEAGGLRPGLSVDQVALLIELAEGPFAR